MRPRVRQLLLRRLQALSKALAGLEKRLAGVTLRRTAEGDPESDLFFCK